MNSITECEEDLAATSSSRLSPPSSGNQPSAQHLHPFLTLLAFSCAPQFSDVFVRDAGASRDRVGPIMHLYLNSPAAAHILCMAPKTVTKPGTRGDIVVEGDNVLIVDVQRSGEDKEGARVEDDGAQEDVGMFSSGSSGLASISSTFRRGASRLNAPAPTAALSAVKQQDSEDPLSHPPRVWKILENDGWSHFTARLHQDSTHRDHHQHSTSGGFPFLRSAAQPSSLPKENSALFQGTSKLSATVHPYNSGVDDAKAAAAPQAVATTTTPLVTSESSISSRVNVVESGVSFARLQYPSSSALSFIMNGSIFESPRSVDNIHNFIPSPLILPHPCFVSTASFASTSPRCVLFYCRIDSKTVMEFLVAIVPVQSPESASLHGTALFLSSIDPQDLPEEGRRSYDERTMPTGFTKVVVGAVVAFFMLEDQVDDCCQVALAVVLNDIHTEQQEFGRTSKLKALTFFLGIPIKLREYFPDRSNALDALQRSRFLHDIMSAPPLTKVEYSFLKSSLAELKSGEEDSYGDIFDPPRERFATEIDINTLMGRSSKFLRVKNSLVNHPGIAFFSRYDATLHDALWIKAIGKVDASFELVFSWLWNFMSLERLREFRSHDGLLPRYERALENTRSKFMCSGKKFPKGFESRWFDNWNVWEKISNEQEGTLFVIAFAPTATYNSLVNSAANSSSEFSTAMKPIDIETPPGFVHGMTRGMFKIRRISENVSEVIIVQVGTAGGSIPTWLVNSRASSALSVLERLQSKFRRGGLNVDKEIRHEFVSKVRASPVTTFTSSAHDSVKKKIYEDSLALLRSGDHGELNVVPSSSNHITLGWFYDERDAGKARRRRVPVVQAFASIDCSAEEALAHQWDFCSNEKMHFDSEAESERRLARVVARSVGASEAVVVTALRTPLLVSNRVFVVGVFWLKGCPDSDSVSYVYKSVPEEPDLGIQSEDRLVVGSSDGIIVFKNVGDEQCIMEFTQKLDFKGSLPKFVVVRKIQNMCQVIYNAVSVFNRDESIDRKNRSALNDAMLHEEQKYCNEEEAAIKTVLDTISTESVGPARISSSITSPDVFVEMEQISVKGMSICIARAETFVDEEASVCAAWDYDTCSRFKMSNFHRFGGIVKSQELINSHHSVYRAEYDIGIGLAHRQFVSDLVWTRSGPDYFANFASPNKTRSFSNKRPVASKSNNIRAEAMSHTTFQRLEPTRICAGSNTSVPQTKVTYTSRVDLGGAIPAFIVKSGTVNSLSYLTQMRLYFDQSQDIDREIRGRTVRIINESREVYSSEETELLNQGRLLQQNIQYFKFESKLLRSQSSLTRISTAVLADSKLWGQASTYFRCSAEEALAYTWETKQRNRLLSSTLKKIHFEPPNHHCQIEFYRKRYTVGLLTIERDFMSKILWRKEEVDGNEFYRLISWPTSCSNVSSEYNRTENRGHVRCCYEFRRLSETETYVVLLLNIDYGNLHLSTFITRLLLSSTLKRVGIGQQYFQELRPLQSYDARDGTAMGEYISATRDSMPLSREGLVDDKVREKIDRFYGLREFTVKHPWFPSLIAGMLNNWIVEPEVSHTGLDNLSNRLASRIGKSLCWFLDDALTSESGTDQWVHTYPALIDLCRNERFFLPMALVISQDKMRRAIWGVLFRVGVGACVSIADVITDVIAVRMFFVEKKVGFAISMLAMIGASIMAQVLIVAIKNKNRGPGVIVRELVLVFTLTKPVIDAWRVVVGRKTDHLDGIDLELEALLSKIVEIALEAIGSAVIQIYAYINSESDSLFPLVSIIFSVIAIAYHSAVISFDFDRSPANREKDPWFYGIVPDANFAKRLSFFFLVVSSACHIVMRTVGIALLATCSGLWAGLYLVGDVALFFLIKIVRDDFRYWVPIDSEFGSFFVSLVFRLVGKVLVDFTALIQLRHPNEFGGVHWWLNLISGQIFAFVAARVYVGSQRGGDERGQKTAAIPETVLFGGLASLEALYLVSFAMFLLKINSRFWRTFRSTMTAKTFSYYCFLNAESDVGRLDTFFRHRSYYAEFEDDLKEFLKEKWQEWQDDRPAWWDDKFTGIVPSRLLPLSNSSVRS